VIAPEDPEHDSVSSIIFRINTIDTEEGKDFIHIYDGPDDTFPLLGSWSGNQIPEEIQTTGDKASITFTSDDKDTGAGWQISYISEFPNYCRDTTFLPLNTASFDDGSGNRKYNNNTECSWHIKPSKPCEITLWFNRFEVEHFYDKVKVYDPVPSPPVLLAEYSGFELPPPVKSTSGELLLTFVTDDAIIYDGWEAQYTISDLGFSQAQPIQYFKISPNPSHDMIQINLSGTNISYPAYFQILNLQGQVYYSGKIISSDHLTLSLKNRNIPRGLFFIRIYNNEIMLQSGKLILL
jgi:hypothetical protein